MKPQLKFFLAFVLINLFLSCYYLDMWTTPSTLSRAFTVYQLADKGVYNIDPFAQICDDKSKIGEHYYSDKAPLPAFFVYPFYALIQNSAFIDAVKYADQYYPIHIWRINGLRDARTPQTFFITPVIFIGSLIVGALPFLLILIMTYYTLQKKKITFSPIYLMLAFYGSYLFVYSGTFFNHIFAAALLLLSYYFIKERKYLWSGIFLGLSFLSEYPVGLAMPLWFVLILLNERKIKPLIYFSAGVLPGVLVLLFYNYYTSGNLLTMSYAYNADTAYKEIHQNYGFRFPSFKSIWGLTFSGYMGLFIFVPLLFVSLFYYIKNNLKSKWLQQVKTNYLAIFTIAYFMMISCYFIWWGGWSYGPRYLIVLAVLLIYESILLLSSIKFSKIAFFILTAAGLIMTWIAKSTLVFMINDYGIYKGVSVNTFFDITLPEFIAGRFNAGNLFTMIFRTRPGIASFLWLLLFIMSLFLIDYLYKKLVAPKVIIVKPQAEVKKVTKVDRKHK
jgi:hypothetical protein